MSFVRNAESANKGEKGITKMRAIVIEVLERLIAVLMIVCVVSGIILMMCESNDTHTQYMTLFGGFGLFIMGALPGIIISAIETRKENKEEWKYLQRNRYGK